MMGLSLVVRYANGLVLISGGSKHNSSPGVGVGEAHLL